MTDEQLANLRRLAEQATTGPWRYASEKEAGDNWLICFGTGRDNSSHYVSHFVTTNNVHATDVQGDARTDAEFVAAARRGLDASPIHEILLEQSVIGWKEYELEVMRDKADQCVIICSIENLDPMGVHTGDSITVAPAQTLSDPEYQVLRNQAFACIRAIGVETGGSNVQFAVDPKTGRTVIIEMNPRVSRSSALASKATGFPIAKIAALLAVGYRLDEIPNDITGSKQAGVSLVMSLTISSRL
jgi:carbamoyl-phosphate synthase large subunit